MKPRRSRPLDLLLTSTRQTPHRLFVRKRMPLLTNLVFLLGSSAAWASPTPPTTGPVADELYYTFDDELLDAVGHAASGVVLRARPGAAHTLLIRPRTQFVDELLSSVEHM